MSVFTMAQARPVAPREYADLVHASVEGAVHRVWVCMFLYDLRPGRDVHGAVLDLTMALVRRRQLGVDARVVLSGQVETVDIAVANMATGLLLGDYRVPHRGVFGGYRDGRRGMHTKFVICDDVAVVGSQNWTDDAFFDNVEDAVLLTGSPVNLLAAEFARLWAVGRRMPTDAT